MPKDRRMEMLNIMAFVPCVTGMALPTFASEKKEIYVSPNGNDNSEGDIGSPLATLAAAKEKAKKLGSGATVYFREGTYTISETVRFDESDSSDVTYKAYNGERVVFTLGVPYTGFEECTVNGVRAFKKDIGKDADLNILFNEREAFTKTRYPESGYLRVKEISDSDIMPEADGSDYYFAPLNGMYAEAGEIGEFKNMTDVIVRILHFWKDEMLPVSSFDSESGHFKFSKYASMSIKQNDRFFLENVFEMLRKPGQWYLDKAEGILYVIPNDGDSPAEYTVDGAMLETMISVDGANGISFENIIFRGNGFSYSVERDFSQAAYDATPCISYENARNFSIKNCEFRDIAACSVFLGRAVQNASVESCIFDNIGAQAVYIRGENVDVSNENVTKDIRVTNNSISKYGRVFFNAVGVLVIHANSVEISHNEIHDGYYTAVSVGWVWGYSYSVTYNNKICDNLIYNIGQGWLSDMGGIYTLGNQPGTVISGNVIHNVAADPDEGGYGGWGIYLDEGSSYITVEKNLAYSCGSNAYHLNYGSYNTVRNNIFVLSGESQFKTVSNLGRVTPDDGGKKTIDLFNNIILTDGGTRAVSNISDKAAWNEYNNIYWDLSLGDDIYIDIGDRADRSIGIQRAMVKGLVTSPTIADPMFRDAANFDFELSPDSPAIAAGFEPWDYADAGTVKGTVIGTATEGGATPYNAESAHVPMTKAKEAFHFLVEFFCKIINFFGGIFRK